MLQTNHPLRRARWIWPGRWDCPRNVYAQFRYDFSQAELPGRAKFYISADQCYKLYVNGLYVSRGPARGHQKNWPFDTVDIGPYLQSGRNWISVVAYNAGVSTFQYIHQTAAGFICAGRWEDMEILSGHPWQMRLAPAYKPATARLSMQLNFQEFFDAREDDSSWITSSEKPTGQGWMPGGSCWHGDSPGLAFGTMPWHDMQPRGIPNLGNTPLPYRRIVSTARGKCSPGWAEQTNLALPLFTELPPSRWRRRKVEPAPLKKTRAKTPPSELSVNLPAAGAGKFAATCLDLGKLGVGTLMVQATGVAGEIVDFFFTEAVRENGKPVLAAGPEYACGAALVARLVLGEGETNFETFQTIGHRYVVAIARETSKPITLKLTHRETLYPMKIRGKFHCSDDVLNDIHAISTRTQQVCMLDAYVDTPWREQAQWWGDARVQAQNTFHLSGDTRLLTRGIDSIAAQALPNGLTFGHTPTVAYGCVLPDFSLTWILTLWDYYYQTGDISLFEKHWPRVKRVLEYFATEGRGKNGLLKYDERYWLFLDWCDIQKQGYPTVLNLWYLLTLEKLIALTSLAEIVTPGEKREIARAYEAQKKLVLRKLWARQAKLFHDGLSLDGEAAARCSIHSQTLAMMCGLHEKHHQHMINKKLRPYLRDSRVASAKPSSFWVTYVYELMTQQGYGSDVVGHLRKHWEPMIPFGGCWEVFSGLQPEGQPGGAAQDGDAGGIGNTSTSHAWAAHPIYHLARTLGGVSQAEVAWRRVKFAPVLGGAGTDQASVAVPTPRGIIRADWSRTGKKKFAVNLSLPRLMKADVTLPNQPKQTATGEKTWLVEV